MEELTMNDNTDTIFIRCSTQEESSKLTSKARNLPQDKGTDSPRLTMWVDGRAMKRFKAMQAIAKSIREHSQNGYQTSIRTGKRDFLLRKRERGSTIPWGEIPPLTITQELPQIEIGQYDDIINPQNRLQEEEDMEKELEEEARDISFQQAGSKREHSTDETSQRKTKAHKHRTNQTTHQMSDYSAEASAEEDESDEDSSNKKIMNSTPNDGHPTIWKDQMSRTTEDHPNQDERLVHHYFSVPDTPAPRESRAQPRGSATHQSIPESPELERQETNMRILACKNNAQAKWNDGLPAEGQDETQKPDSNDMKAQLPHHG